MIVTPAVVVSFSHLIGQLITISQAFTSYTAQKLFPGGFLLFHNTTCTRKNTTQRVALHGCHVAKSRLPVTHHHLK